MVAAEGATRKEGTYVCDICCTYGKEGMYCLLCLRSRKYVMFVIYYVLTGRNSSMHDDNSVSVAIKLITLLSLSPSFLCLFVSLSLC